MKLFQFKSIRHRLIILLLLPITVMLLASGFIGFLFSRNIIIKQWETSAILKLERAAHSVEMRLNNVIDWMEMFHESGQIDTRLPSQQWIIQRLESLEGVTQAKLKFNLETTGRQKMQAGGSSLHLHSGGSRRLHFHRGRLLKLTSPALNTQEGMETVSIYSSLLDTDEREVAQLWVELRFDYLMQDILKYGWWQSERAFLVDHAGRFILHTSRFGRDDTTSAKASDPFEIEILKQSRNKPFGTLFDRGRPPKNVAGFYNIESARWSIVLVAPGDELLAPVIRFRNYFLLGVLGLSAVVVLLTRYHLRQIVRPVTELTLAAQAVAKENYDTHIEPKTVDEIGQLTIGFNNMVEGLREKKLIRNTFGRYMDPEIARKLLKSPYETRLGGEERKVAVLMADIRNFTPLTESMAPEATISMLNLFFSIMVRVVNQNQGIIVDFLGDGIMAFFDSAGKDSTTVARLAVGCGLAMQEQMADLKRKEPPEGSSLFEIGVGINFGDAVVGNIGSMERTKYGIVGSTVNATDRIQSLAKGGQVIISEPLRNLLGDRVEISDQFTMVPKGFNHPITLFVVKACHCEIESNSGPIDAKR